MATEMSMSTMGMGAGVPAMQALGSTPEVEPGKLFVGGLSWKTTKESLSSHFSKYGELEDCTVMSDKEGQPRGFGFIKFKNPEHTKAALCASDNERMLDGKKIDPKPATKNSQNGPVKVFVGGIPSGVEKEELKQAFQHFGQICDGENSVSIKMDASTGRSRGFGFVTFVSKDAADAAIRQHWVNIKEKQVEVKVAENQKPKGGPGMSFHPGGYNDASQYGYGSHYSHDRHMTQQQPAAYHYTSQQYHHNPYQQPPYSNYPQSGYSNGSGGYMYGQGASTHSPAMNSYEGFSGYSATRDSGYAPQQYSSYTGQQQQPAAYGGGQATHTAGYPRTPQQGTAYSSYPVHQ